MAGMKSEIVKELKSMGVRKFDKPGYGSVSIKQGKTSELLTYLTQLKSEVK